MIPMSEFYQLNPKLIQRYQPYLMEKRDYEAADVHFRGWVAGQYVTSAIGSNFSRKHKYPNKPHYMLHSGYEEDEEAYQITDAERFAAFATMFNAGMRGKTVDVNPDELKTVDVSAEGE